MLVDTGYLVALGRARDSLHAKADRFLSAFRGTLFTVPAVITETCFFMDANAKAHLHTYPTVERNGMVWFWYHPHGTEPLWEIPELDEYEDPTWSDYLRAD